MRPARDRGTVRPRPPFLALLTALLLAGCASHGHEDGHHGGDGRPIERSVLVGVENKGERELAANVTLADANGTLLWSVDFPVAPSALPEKHHTLNATGVFTVALAWTWSEAGATKGGRETATVDTTDCTGLSHLTFVIARDGSFEELHRECHE